MNEALARRVFLAVMVACLLFFALVSGDLFRGIGDLEIALHADHQTAGSRPDSQTTTPIVNELGASEKKLSAVDRDIATSSSDLTQATADIQDASSR